MDFGLNRQQEMIKDMVREFVQEELAPNVARWDDSGEFPVQILRKIAGLRLIGTGVEMGYGGNKLGHTAAMLIIEELSRGYPAAAMMFSVVDACSWILQRHAAQELKEKYIAAICRGEKYACFATTEPTGGSYIAGMQTTAQDRNGGFIISGRKALISMAGIADLAIVSARHNGKIDIFAVEKGIAGYAAPRQERMWGLRGCPLSELVFSDCYLPRESLLGKEGDGMKLILQNLVANARPGAGALAAGLARGAFDEAARFVTERKLGNKYISDFQAIQMMLADMDTAIDAARWLLYHCAWLLDQGRTSREIARESAMVKLFCVDVAIDVCRKAIQVMGGYGVSLDYTPLRRLNDALAMLAADGTPEINRLIIAGELLKK